ncbi:MAG: putative protein YqeN [Eubacteriales bacterium SKADARSKE-1]|nr:putative protein YqeN [Eubacteriales bacterium SKADARSKE-1]
MPNITENDLNTQINSKNFKNLYFLFGEEKYLVNYYTDQLVSSILGNNKNDFNFQTFKSLEEIVDLETAVEALPLMSSVKCIKMVDLNIETLSQENLKKFKEIISSLPETTTLIISQINVEVNLKKSSKWLSLLKLLSKHGDVLELKKLSKNFLCKQIVSWTKNLSCEISQKNAEILIDYAGENLIDLKSEIEKLCAFCNSQEITAENIEMLVIKKLEANIFELSKAIANKNVTKALNILNVLFYKREEPIAILAILSSAFIDMYRVKVGKSAGEKPAKLADYFDYKGKAFKLDIADRNSYNLSLKSIRKCINALLETDFKLKSSRVDNKILMEELIVKLVSFC